MNSYVPSVDDLNSALEEASINAFKVAFSKCKNADDARLVLNNYTKFLIDEYHIKTVRGNKGEIYIYEEGIYIRGEDIVRQIIHKDIEEIATTHLVKEIMEKIRYLSLIKREDFTVPPNLLNFKNGVFDLDRDTFAEHNPNNLFLTKIPVNYDPSANCPLIKTFLSEILNEEQLLIIQEWFGFGLYRKYFIKKALILVGQGDTGKSTLLNLMSYFFGLLNISGITLQKISTDKFASSNLYAKHINILDDLPKTDISDNGGFKIATGGGIITGEKKFGDQFQFMNYAKLTFACNKIPDVKDVDDDAYFLRWIVLNFDFPIPDDKKDKRLIDKITTDEELSGLLNFALIGLKRLLENESFSYKKSIKQIKEEMQRSGSPLANFAYTCLIRDDDGYISKDSLHEAFIFYTRTNNLPSMSKENLGKMLPRVAPYVNGDYKPTVYLDDKKKQITAWGGVRFEPEFEKTIPKEVEQMELDSMRTENNISDWPTDFQTEVGLEFR